MMLNFTARPIHPNQMIASAFVIKIFSTCNFYGDTEEVQCHVTVMQICDAVPI